MTPTQLPQNGTGTPYNAEDYSSHLLVQAVNELKDVVFALDVNGCIVYINKSCTPVLGYEPGEMIGKKYSDFIVGRDIDKWEKAFGQVVNKKPGERFISHNYHKNGNIVSLMWSGSWNDQDKMMYCIAQDVTNRLQAQKTKKKLNKTLNTALDRMTDGFLVVDNNWQITYWNKGAESILKPSKKSKPAKNFWNYFAKSADNASSARFQTALHQQKSDCFEASPLHQSAVLEVSVYPCNKGLSLIIKDITERKKGQQRQEDEKEERRKNLTAAVLRQQEKERSYFGRELHDNVNQVLTTIKLYNEMCLIGGGENKELLKKSNEMLLNTINEIRDISKKLSAPTLGDIELFESVKELVNSIVATNSINITLDISGIEGVNFSQELHIGIYRIVQEHLNNILLHAEAETVQITIRRTNKTLSLMIADDGKGFNMTQQNTGSGMNNMIGRAESLDGSLRLIGLPGCGCTLVATFPYRLHEELD